MKSEKYIIEKVKGYKDDLELEDINLYSMNYSKINERGTKKLFETFHSLFTWHFINFNSRLNSGHYSANDSRRLITIINNFRSIRSNLMELDLIFSMDRYYEDIISQLRSILQSSGGTPIPQDFKKIEIPEVKPIFYLSQSVSISNRNSISYTLINIGQGSYASVSKYEDNFYNKTFAVKKANNLLKPKERKRFKKEFETMKKLSSPYILEVYNFNESKYEYTMEYADFTMNKYIDDNNTKLQPNERIGLPYVLG